MHNKYKLLYCRCGIVVMRIEFVKVVGHRWSRYHARCNSTRPLNWIRLGAVAAVAVINGLGHAVSCRQTKIIWALWQQGEGYLLISPWFSAPVSPTLTKFCIYVARLLLRYAEVSDLLQLLAFWNYKLVFNSTATCWKFWGLIFILAINAQLFFKYTSVFLQCSLYRLSRTASTCYR